MHIFISYSRADWLYVQEIARAIRRRGVATWVDIENLLPGEMWAPAVNGAIDASLGFVFCISPLGIESQYSSRELRRALNAGKPIFPVMVESVDIGLLMPEIKERQILELWRYPPRLGAEKASQSIIERLGLSRPVPEPPASDADESSRVLLLYLGRIDQAETRRRVCAQLGILEQGVVERAVQSPADYRLVDQLISNARSVFVVLGEGAALDACVLLLGAVLGGGGSSGLCVLHTAGHEAFARTVAAPLKIRCVELQAYHHPGTVAAPRTET